VSITSMLRFAQRSGYRMSGNADGMRFVEPQNLACAQRKPGFGIDNLLAVKLDATLLDQAARLGARFLNSQCIQVGGDNDRYCVIITRGKFRKLRIAKSLFAEACVPILERFLGNNGRVIGSHDSNASCKWRTPDGR
jgi:hypothetical protein